MGDVGERGDALSAWGAWGGRLQWATTPDAVHVGVAPDDRWFPGGRLNVAENCLDHHLPHAADRPAVHWEGEPGDRRTLTYGELADEVRAAAGALRDLGVAPGDRVAVYAGWIPETVVTMLACARLGAVHAVVPAPLPPEALADRLALLSPKVLVTADGAWRRGAVLPLKAAADEALAAVEGVEATIVVRRVGLDVPWYEGDRWWTDLVDAARDGAADVAPAVVDADAPLLALFVGGERGLPLGFVHRSAGFLAYTLALHETVMTSSVDDVMWCAVDVGWVAGQSHGVYGPLVAGATCVMYEGTLDVPDHERAWEIVERYGVASLMTTPSVVRALRQWSDEAPPRDRGRSLRRVVTGGEPLDEATSAWLREQVLAPGAVIADVWGQTELGGGVLVRRRQGDMDPLPDGGFDIVGAEGLPVRRGDRGELVLRHPWPALYVRLLRDGGGDPRHHWRWNGLYASGDAAMRDDGGGVVVLGRIDHAVSVSGQLVSAREVRQVLVEHPYVADAEVVHREEPDGGHVVVACVVLRAPAERGAALAGELRAAVREVLGGLAQPRGVVFCDAFPEDVPRPVLHRTLQRLVAARRDDAVVVTAAEVVAAANQHVA